LLLKWAWTPVKLTSQCRHNQCPQCGTPLPTGALAGLCPACCSKWAGEDTVTTRNAGGSIRQASRLAAKFTQLEILELHRQGGMERFTSAAKNNWTDVR